MNGDWCHQAFRLHRTIFYHFVFGSLGFWIENACQTIGKSLHWKKQFCWHFIKVSSYVHMSSRTNGKTYRPTFCKHLEPSTHLCHSNVQTVFVIISVWNCIISLISTRPHLGQNFLSSAGTARDPSWSVGLVSRIISQDQRFPRTERLESYSSIFCNISHLVKANCNT